MLPPLLARPRGSLRRWLLGASVVAVLAGYGVLLLAYGWLSDLDRREAHRQLEAVLLAELARGGRLEDLSRAHGAVAWVAGEPVPSASQATKAGTSPRSARLAAPRAGPPRNDVNGPWFYQGRSYLFSSTPLGPSRPGVFLHVLHDVSLEMGQQQRNSKLLVAFAGISTLVTAALLRPVLDAGLQPLQALSEGMERIEADLLAQQRLSLGPQPRELRRIARSFNDLLERLAISWDRQRSFVNGVSHELRTPITLVAGYAARLRRRGENLTADQRQQLQLIEEEAARMGRMVGDLLDLARGDAGQLILRRIPFSVHEACLQVIERLRPVAGPRLSLRSPLPLPRSATVPLALGERERFEQCLINLVENALKYSPPGSPVRLGWERRDGWMVVHVSDEGPGVPEADRSRLLERFQRGRNTADIPGSGIGLAVVNTLMQAMGGAVRIAAAAGGGADFQLLLPGATEPEALPPAEAAAVSIRPGAPSDRPASAAPPS